jgi:hypothetical protein
MPLSATSDAGQKATTIPRVRRHRDDEPGGKCYTRRLSTEGASFMATDRITENHQSIIANQATILRNQRSIQQNQRTILANQKRIEQNQKKLDQILTNQKQILANQRKIMQSR